MKSSNKKEHNLWIFSFNDLSSLMVALLLLVFTPWPASAIDISDIPLDSQLNAAAPNFMIGLDDSGSMDWEIMADTSDGLFQLGSKSYEYIFDDPSDENLYQTGLNSDILTGDNRLYFLSQWSGYNYVYYNPAITYKPWANMPNADTVRPRHHPYYANKDGKYINLDDTFAAVVVSGSGTTITMDDGDNSGVAFTGHWSSDHTDHWTSNTGDTCTYTPNIPTAGNYQVLVYTSDYSNSDSNAKYTISYNGGSSVQYLNQVGGNNWTSLGIFNFSSGSSGSVTVTRTSSGWWSATIADQVRFVPVGSGSVIIPNAHYYVKSETGQLYLVTLTNSTIQYYAINDDGDNKLEAGEAVLVNGVPSGVPATGRSYDDERQNFANWFSYHRKRILTATSAICEIIPKLKGVNVGIRSINGHIKKAVVPVQVAGVDRSSELIAAMTSYRQSDFGDGASTPLREGLDKIGRYYDTRTGTNYDISPSEPVFDGSPLSSGPGGACQQNFVMMFSDGSDNGGAAGMGNEDKNEGAPYADDASGTLADIAMHYYKTDLNPNVADNVQPNGVDNAKNQHMVTYMVGFGVKGNLNPDDYVLYATPGHTVHYPTWPSPVNDDQKKIDDMWHAAVNGRGKYLNAKSPQELLDAFNEIVADVLSRIGSGASVSINGEELSDDTRLYQSTYSTNEWTGDVTAYTLTSSGRGGLAWNNTTANVKLNSRNWDTGRKIATYTGSAGVPFRYNSLTTSQKALLDANATKAEQIVNYLRGDWTNEVSSTVTGTKAFRDRVVRGADGAIIRDHNKLGDIVHSAPVFMDNILYVGANDGMMHAFNAADGEELFAYVPNLVFENLKLLSSPAYTHKYFVDMSPFVKKIDVTVNGAAARKTLLVGALGKGGKGIYCLDVTNAIGVTNETQAADMVKWEFPATPGSDPDMGYTFSKPYIVKTAAGPAVVFGNGYNSTNGNAILYIVNADTGVLIKKIDTGVGSDNGLSTPNIVDVDADTVVDYVYAGDLKGNLWKFNIRGSDTSKWAVSYLNNGSPAPLFTAIGPAPANNIQPITARPDVMLHCQAGLPGYIVVFGSGKYLGSTDLGNTDTQTIYGLWDYGDDADKSEFLGSFSRTGSRKLSNQPMASLLAQTVIYYGAATDSNIVRVLSNNQPVWLTQDDVTAGQNQDPSTTAANNAGWYFDLPNSGERMIQDVIIRDGLALVISSTPSGSNPCSPGGTSIYHEMNACSGARLDRSHFNLHPDNKIDASDLVEVSAGVWLSATGVYFDSMIYPPVILRTPDGLELKVIGTASGGTAILGTDPETRGIFYWRSY